MELLEFLYITGEKAFMKFYMHLHYEHSTPRYYSREMNSRVHKKICTRMSIVDLCIKKRKNTPPDCCRLEVGGLAIRDFLQLNIDDFKEPKPKMFSL